MSGATVVSPPRRVGRRGEIPPRILMLCTGDPSSDPRIQWAARLASEIAVTRVLGTVWHPADEYRTYEEDVYTERFSIALNASRRALERHAALGTLHNSRSVTRYLDREGRRPELPADRPGAARLRLARLDHQVGSFNRFAASLGYYGAIASAIERRARAEPIPPSAIVALDLYALVAASALRRRFDCSLVYDSHELWPYADLLSEAWEPLLIARLEKRLLRNAHAVITVSTPLARTLERMYGLREVLTVPNATPIQPGIRPSSERAPASPVKFLLQGAIAPGRGFDRLLEGWRGVDPARATLYIRCPQHPYLRHLRAGFSDLWETGRVEELDAVSPDDLVEAATFADVGVIPYVGPNPNHVFCCPNKLSQYMQAGLAVLTNDLPYVRSVVERFQCGAVYTAEQPATVAEAVDALTRDPEALRRMKQRARAGALEHFNWSVVSAPYREALAGAVAATEATRT
jgi:glycosyltransferase involved in cell wall biosynthesis